MKIGFPPAGLAARALAAALALSGLVSCAGKPLERSELVLGTVCSIRALSGGTAKALDAAFARLRAIEDEMSANADDSVVAAINAAAGKAPVAAPADLRYVVSKALEYAARSGGAFDPTIGPVVKLWNIGREGERVPAQAELDAALPLVSYRDLVVDDAAGTVFLRRPGMRMDLGAIAKGYAADEAGKILSAKGVRAAVIDLGGNVKVIGAKPGGDAWRIGIQNPFDDRGSRLGIATLKGDYTVVTSGVYERFFLKDGVRYHHILSPADGKPVSNGLASATIICRSSIDADALSTSAFSLGLEKGMALIESLDEVEAVFVDEARKVYMSSGAKALFAVDDASFSVAAP